MASVVVTTIEMMFRWEMMVARRDSSGFEHIEP